MNATGQDTALFAQFKSQQREMWSGFGVNEGFTKMVAPWLRDGCAVVAGCLVRTGSGHCGIMDLRFLAQRTHHIPQ